MPDIVVQVVEETNNTPSVVKVIAQGQDGRSAYQAAVAAGFEGTEQEWLDSLKGEDGDSAYEVAVANGFVGTEQEWLDSLGSGGSGAVGSVNGQTGAVVLDAEDVGAATAAQGALADTALQPGEAATPAQGALADTALQPGDLPDPYTLPPATAETLGGVRIGSGINVLPDGTISAAAQPGTGTDLSYTASTRLLASSTGADVTLPEVVAGGDSGLMTGAQATKLAGIESSADVTDQTNVVAALDGATVANVTLQDSLAVATALTDGATPVIDAEVAPIRTWTLGANGRTPSIVWGDATAARMISLLITGNGFDTVNWSTIAPTWVGAEPTISASGVTSVSFLRVNGVTYGFAGAGAGVGGAVDSVNGQTGAVVLDAADVGAATAAQGALADSALQPGEAATPAQGALADSALQPGDLPAPYTLPVADAGTLGGVRIGSGINVLPDGTISAAAQPGTGTDLSYDPATRLLASSSGADVTLPLAGGANAGLMASADFTKLTGITPGAEVNAVDSVNGQTGAVVLDAGDVGADPAGTAAAAVSAHEAAADPHPEYLTAAEGSAAFDAAGAAAAAQSAAEATAAGALSAHEAAGDPHPGYALESALGDAASRNVGTTAGTVAAGDDARLSDARTPTAHAASHAAGQADELTPADIGAATAAQGALADTAVQPGDLATVATTGAYSDLTGSPAIPSTPGDIGAATAAQGALADSAVQPGDLATVATTGAYADLTGQPSIPSTPGDIGAATAAQGALADSAIQPGNAALTNAREWTAATIEQAEAEAGTATTRRAFTAQRVRQAVVAWWATISSTIATLSGTETLSNKTLGNTRESVTAIADDASVVIDMAGAGIQTWTLGATRTATFSNIAAGRQVLLSVTSGGNGLTLTGADWGDAGAPTLGSVTDIELWSVDGVTVRAAVAWSAA